MKTLSILITLLISIKSFACDCYKKDFLEAYADADIVLTAKVVDITRNGKSAGYSNLNLEPIDIYKGNFENQIKLYNEAKSMCVFYPPIDTTWLFFATKDTNNGYYTMRWCNSSKQLDKQFYNNRAPNAEKHYYWHVPLTLDLFQFLSKNKLNPNYDSKIQPIIESFSIFDKYKNADIEGGKFAYYEVTVDKSYNIVNLVPIIEFGNPKLREELLTDIYNNLTILKQKTSLSDITTVTFILHYYKDTSNRTRIRTVNGLR
ncbi:hypothetical protein M0G43_13360 [Subsaxibacter sp. CAU 1640]|uniref:hypothetical protein n=1 Tax=Subsaxibacter sp. CAU 1640 TaxID=2933271 RepID=UPI0020058223|nr:hypothetical protein [Subsaxibacter sp. CAU 1640]MCK7591569.1 hypothetical protein [Subsaxibacter sp. CAU 1640]